MRLSEDDRAVIDAASERGSEIVARAVDWCGVNSGSRNLPGLERQRALLEPVLDAFSGRLERLPLAPSIEIGGDGREREQAHGDALRFTVRPNAPVQVALTGHYYTVYGADSAFT